MKRRIATLVFLAAAAAAQAEVVGVMADSATGAIYPASVESRVAPTVLELDMAPGVFVTVQGLVQSVYSDAEQNQEENIRFDTNFPASRLEWEDWRGAVRHITTGADGYTGTFDAAPPECVTNGCCFYVDGEEPPIARFIAAMGETVEFYPALQANETCSVSSIRGAVCDSYGLHAGAVTDNDLWLNIQASPTLGNNYPALACSADGRIVFKTAQNQTVWRSRDGGDAWEELSASPTLGNTPALACSADGRIVFKTAQNQTVWRSRDGGDAWEELSASPTLGNNNPALACSADGRIVFKTALNQTVWRSRDGGDAWEELSASPTLGNTPALACSADGRIVFKTAQNQTVWRSRDGGDAWEELSASPTLGNYPALACSADGRIVFKTALNQTVWRSRDGGDAWEELSASPTLGNYTPALACSADGRIVFKTAQNQTVWRSTPTFGALSRTAYTVLVDAVPRVIEKIRDFYAVDRGEQRAFWALRTGANRYSVYDTGTDPIGWYDIAWESDGTWYIRTTNGPAATTATTAPEAVSAAAEAWSRNLALEWQYQPHYGYSRFDGGTNVEWALTFVPDANAVTNAPGVSGMGVLFSAFGDTLHWDTDAFRIDIVSTNPTVSKVTWAGDVATHATIRYIPEE